jgi:hypothetical protein
VLSISVLRALSYRRCLLLSSARFLEPLTGRHGTFVALFPTQTPVTGTAPDGDSTTSSQPLLDPLAHLLPPMILAVFLPSIVARAWIHACYARYILVAGAFCYPNRHRSGCAFVRELGAKLSRSAAQWTPNTPFVS